MGRRGACHRARDPAPCPLPLARPANSRWRLRPQCLQLQRLLAQRPPAVAPGAFLGVYLPAAAAAWVRTQTHTEGQPCEDAGRRRPLSARLGEQPREDQPCSDLGFPASKPGRGKSLYLKLPVWGLVGSPGKLQPRPGLLTSLCLDQKPKLLAVFPPPPSQQSSKSPSMLPQAPSRFPRPPGPAPPSRPLTSTPPPPGSGHPVVPATLD